MRLLEVSFMAALLKAITSPAVLERMAQRNRDDLPIQLTTVSR
jgi:hypothetical protein